MASIASFRRRLKEQAAISISDGEWLSTGLADDVCRTVGHQIDLAIRDGRARDYKALAQQMGISDARIGQIVGLCQLAPDIQEQILNGDARTLGNLSPRQLSKIAEVIDWQVQRRQFNALLAHA